MVPRIGCSILKVTTIFVGIETIQVIYSQINAYMALKKTLQIYVCRLNVQCNVMCQGSNTLNLTVYSVFCTV